MSIAFLKTILGPAYIKLSGALYCFAAFAVQGLQLGWDLEALNLDNEYDYDDCGIDA